MKGDTYRTHYRNARGIALCREGWRRQTTDALDKMSADWVEVDCLSCRFEREQIDQERKWDELGARLAREERQSARYMMALAVAIPGAVWLVLFLLVSR